MKKFLFVIITLCSFGFAQGQHHIKDSIDMVKILGIEQTIDSLEEKIGKLIKKKPELAKMKGLRQYHVFFLMCDGDIGKQDFLDHSFLYKLKYSYDNIYKPSCLFCKNKMEKYLSTFATYITDSIGNLVAGGDANYIYIKTGYRDKTDNNLAKMLFDKKLDFVFMLCEPFSITYIVGVKGNKLYGLDGSSEGIHIYPWEKFIESFFDEWKN